MCLTLCIKPQFEFVWLTSVGIGVLLLIGTIWKRKGSIQREIVIVLLRYVGLCVYVCVWAFVYVCVLCVYLYNVCFYVRMCVSVCCMCTLASMMFLREY